MLLDIYQHFMNYNSLNQKKLDQLNFHYLFEKQNHNFNKFK
jgi:hypothetical protein